ncbi:hypothetical protein ID866_12221 [Astraeus odoratus]|nr:hypothetical protein ID866_12221 [Astraeus odoratus]
MVILVKNEDRCNATRWAIEEGLYGADEGSDPISIAKGHGTDGQCFHRELMQHILAEYDM